MNVAVDGAGPGSASTVRTPHSDGPSAGEVSTPVEHSTTTV